MRKQKITCLCVLLFILFTQVKLNAQVLSREVVCAGGEALVNPNLSIVFTIGEAFGGLQSNVPESRFLTLGFVQPDIELKEILSKDISRQLTLFPNPAPGGQVKLALNNLPDALYYIDLIDVLGNVLQTTTVYVFNNNFLYVPLTVSSLAKGTYFLRVRSSLKYNGQVKLIKL